MDALWQDLRNAARRLAKSPGFALVAVLTLALGIGANTAIFQLMDAVRLRSLPVQKPEELAEIRITHMEDARGTFTIWHAGATNRIWEQIRHRQQAFTSVFAWSPGGVGYSLAPDGEQRLAQVVLVSGEFFSTLGVRPQVGRLLTAADDQKGCSAPGTVLSHAFWQKEFAGDPRAIGKKITMGRYPFEIVGVTPPEFNGLEVGKRFDVMVPLCAEALPPGSYSRLDHGTDWFLMVGGRLKPGWTRDKASAHLDVISQAVFAASLPPDYPKANVAEYLAYRLRADSLSAGVSMLREDYTDPLLLLQVTAGLVLLIGCANLANLMLARAAAREREVAVRVALGAGRGGLVRLLLSESLLLSAAGALAGVWLADGLSKFVVDYLTPPSSPLFLDLKLDWRIFAFTSTAAVLTCVLFGLAPALRATRVSPDAILRAGGRSMTDASGRSGLRRLLVVTQVGLSLVLVVGALLFARSLHNLMRQDIGLQPKGVLITYLDMSQLKLPVERRWSFRQELMRQLEQVPGVTSVAETNVIPLSGMAWDNKVWMEGTDSAQGAKSFFMRVSDGYFRTMGMELLSGRNFDAHDTPAAPLAAIVNETFARMWLQAENPVGKRFWREETATDPEQAFEIVGLVKDAKYQNLRQQRVPVIYLPASQEAKPNSFAMLFIRSDVPTANVIPALRKAFTQASSQIVPTFQDYAGMVDETLIRDRLVAILSGFFGGLAVLLATLGLYGVISFAVARRTNEIGIRMALGADRPVILKMILGEAFALVGIGLVAGGVLALALAQTVRTLVYGLEPSDPVTLFAAALFLAAVALGASLLPARRAAKLDPMVALRYE